MSVGSKVTQITDHLRRVQIDSAKMNPRQRHLFEMYLGMGDDRTIEKLYGWCRDNGVVASYQTLKNWSTKFAWQGLIEQIDQNIALELGRLLLPEHVERVRLDLRCFQRLKLDFQAKVEAGEVEITLDEYLKICKTEDMLTNKPLERKQDSDITDRVTVEIEREDLAVAMAISAARKHGLPMPREVTEQMKNVTPDDNTISQ
jgi:hypothetical protein